MKRRSKQASPGDPGSPNVGAIIQFKVWLQGISPMAWRRLQVPASSSLQELHGVIQVAMGWEGIHLYQFKLHAARYGSWELAAASADVTLAELYLRKGARFLYEYDLHIPWRHEIRVEDRLEKRAGQAYPGCIAGAGACPPEDCGGPDSFMARRDDLLSLEAFDDLETMAGVLGEIAEKRRADILDDEETRLRLEEAVERSKARERAQGRSFSRRTVNARLQRGEHLELMHQQW
jgi:hypothetical protein